MPKANRFFGQEKPVAVFLFSRAVAPRPFPFS